MRWTDIHHIAEELADAHPGADVAHIRFTELKRMVEELPDFADAPERCNERVLEAIQQAWLEELG